MTALLAYLVSFRCYGTWIPGSGPHWTRRHTAWRPAITEPPDRVIFFGALRSMRRAPVRLGTAARAVAAQSIEATCAFKGWRLWEVYVGAMHVHLVVTADAAPPDLLGTLKRKATRALREAGIYASASSPWARRGNVRWVTSARALDRVRDYVRSHHDEARS